jgi:NAD(P)-dependent dehydrogenase (short-subunit alcohol dehydrogenase family)
LAPRKIRVNSIAAGAVDTAMHQRVLESTGEESKATYESSHLLGFGKPQDIANVAAFLLGDAGKWITGTVMVADGGYMVR